MPDTNVPPPVFGDSGFVAPPESQIVAGVFADINAAFGGNLDPGLSTPQGQLASTEAAIIGDSNAAFLWLVAGFDPATSSGRNQDALGRIYFITRNPALPTAVTVAVSGLPDVVIPNATFAEDTNGNVYIANGDITIGADGTGTGQFDNIVTGPIPCPAGTLTKITQAIFGWDTITNPNDGVLGNVVESRADFEQRRAAATAVNSIGSLPSVLGAVLTVPGVLDAFVFDNNSATAELVGGVVMAARSLFVCVAGGSDTSVAFAIWTRKAPGCGYTGNTTVTVTDPSPSYSAPAPSYPVTFTRPTSVPFYVLVNITDSPTVPANAGTLVSNAVVAAFAGADGGPRARIGSLVYASRYYGPVMALGPWARNIVSITVGTEITASIVGSIAGSTMTVTSVASGHLRVGDLLLGGSGLASPTVISGLLSGTGLTGTYLVSGSQALASGTLEAVAMFNDVQMNLDQAPTVSGSGVYLQLS